MGDPGAYETFWITNPTRCRIYSMRHKISGAESYKVGWRIQLISPNDNIDFCLDALDKEKAIDLYSQIINFIDSNNNFTMIVKLLDICYSDYSNQLFTNVEYSIE